tara:strand:- start:1 stop:171 length:171 start_codon:yes stop_codon:yes gene_type:complete
MSYQLVNSIFPDGSTNQTSIIKRKIDNVFIPCDQENTDYQEYLEWVAAGNTAEAAD